MFVRIILLKNGASSPLETYFIESESQETAVNCLVRQHKINLTNYSTVLVTDLTSQTLKDHHNKNDLNCVIGKTDENCDLLLSYNKEEFLKTINYKNLTINLFDLF